MTITRELPAAIILAAGVAIGSAGTASADGPLQPSPGEPERYLQLSVRHRQSQHVGNHSLRSRMRRRSRHTRKPDQRVVPYGGRAMLNNGSRD